MDGGYSRRNTTKASGIIIICLGILLLLGGIYWFFVANKSNMVSPLPPNPSYEIIFNTPTAGPTEAISTPSATPKVKTGVPSVTIKPSVKPSNSPTPNPTG
jgi:hypothetical protein